MPFFGSDWNDNDLDDGPIGISSSMKEAIRSEAGKEAKTTGNEPKYSKREVGKGCALQAGRSDGAE